MNWTKVDEHGWMDESGLKRMKVDQNEMWMKWRKVGETGWKWMKMDEKDEIESNRIKVDENGWKWMKVHTFTWDTLTCGQPEIHFFDTFYIFWSWGNQLGYENIKGKDFLKKWHQGLRYEFLRFLYFIFFLLSLCGPTNDLRDEIWNLRWFENKQSTSEDVKESIKGWLWTKIWIMQPAVRLLFIIFSTITFG